MFHTAYVSAFHIFSNSKAQCIWSWPPLSKMTLLLVQLYKLYRLENTNQPP